VLTKSNNETTFYGKCSPGSSLKPGFSANIPSTVCSQVLLLSHLVATLLGMVSLLKRHSLLTVIDLSSGPQVPREQELSLTYSLSQPQL
jgi:hypothetical protein